MKVTDPKGNWRTYESAAFGNLAKVTEPDPADPVTGRLYADQKYMR